MSIAEISSQRASLAAGSFSSGGIAFPGDVTIGSLIILAGSTFASGVLNTITVSKASGSATIGAFNVIRSIVGFPDAGLVFIAYAMVTGSGSLTLTATLATTGYINAITDEFTGVDTSVPLDVNGGELEFGGGVTDIVDTISTTYSNDLIIGVISGNAGGTWVPGSGYIEIGSDPTGTYVSYSAIYKIAGATGDYSVDWSWSTPCTEGTLVNAGFKDASSSGSTTPAAIVSARPIRSQLRW